MNDAAVIDQARNAAVGERNRNPFRAGYVSGDLIGYTVVDLGTRGDDHTTANTRDGATVVNQARNAGASAQQDKPPSRNAGDGTAVGDAVTDLGTILRKNAVMDGLDESAVGNAAGNGAGGIEGNSGVADVNGARVTN